MDEQAPVSSLQVAAAKEWLKEDIDGPPKDEEEVDDNKDLPKGFWLLEEGNSSVSTIDSLDVDPLATLQEGLDEIEREINNHT